jgi:hypothetical protein
MTDNLDIIPNWVIDLTKGGPGSGEHEGHPFRGNRWTHSGPEQAVRHNLNGNERTMSASDHFATAKAHMLAGMNLLHQGKFNQAADRFDKAAKHGALASRKGSGMKYQRGDDLYHDAHLAGEFARLASRAHGHLNSHTEVSPGDLRTLNNLGRTATATTGLALDQANKAMGTLASVTSEGLDRGGINYSATN